MNAIDTNVWIYAHDVRDPRKQRLAIDLIAGMADLALPWQVGCEFLAAARKLEPFGFRRQDAWQALEHMQTLAEAVLLPTPELWQVAARIEAGLGLSFWDSLLVAACLTGGVQTLYSEDFGDRPAVEQLRIVNPFR